MRLAKVFSALMCMLIINGCAVVEFVTPEGPPDFEDIAASYNNTELKTSNAADVLTMIHDSRYELLSQSPSVLASVGQKKKGHKVWFNMVAFEENLLTAERKYLFCVDERRKVLAEPRTGLRFDCQMLLSTEVLEAPYADENAMRIAVLQEVQEKVRKDIDEVGTDNNTLTVSGMMINQGLEAALVKLGTSPVQAVKLTESAGLDFSHLSLDRGRIGMLMQGDIVIIKMRLGSLADTFDENKTGIKAKLSDFF